MSFEHLFVELALLNCRISTFCRLSTFWKWVSVTFSDVFTTQIIPRFDFFPFGRRTSSLIFHPTKWLPSGSHL